MNAVLELDFAALASSEDFELASLSDEQFQSLWAMERMEVDPDSAPLMVAGLRSLVAAGLAEATVGGDVLLQGAAALIRQIQTQSVPAMVTQPVRPDDPGRPRTWLLAAPGFVLEQRWSPVGVHHFTLRRLTRAVRELVDDLIPAGSASSDDMWTWSQEDKDSTERLNALFEVSPRVTQVAVAIPVNSERADPAAEWTESVWLFINDGNSPGRVIVSQPDGSAEVWPIDRSRTRTLFLDKLMSDASSDGPVERSNGSESWHGS